MTDRNSRRTADSSDGQWSRRGFLAGLSAGSLVLAARSVKGESVEVTDASQADLDAFEPDLFVSVAPNGTVTILAHRSEMGTGIRTSLPRVVADELEADWERVKIQQAIGDARLGSQNTDGSNSIRHFFTRMRVAGATARTMLERAAAKKWSVDAAECRGSQHQVVHAASGRSIGYGDLVDIARTLKVPAANELVMKPRSEWKYIGKDAPITDLEEILTGRAVFGIDARMEGQLYAVVARPPVFGGRLKSWDASDAKTVPGVVDVVELPAFEGAPVFQPLGGVAVCATSTWAAVQGRDALQLEWEHGSNQAYDSTEFAAILAESASKSGNVIRDNGDAAAVIAASDRVVVADYSVPHLSHAPMETPAAVASVTKDQNGAVVGCTITAATQNPQAVQQAVAPALGLNVGDVIVNVTLLGAGFGRKSKPDYCVEAALLSRQLDKPVHVTWMREDDIQNDY
jgi:isoquinoline 1-oxidoreductase beta subunit